MQDLAVYDKCQNVWQIDFCALEHTSYDTEEDDKQDDNPLS